MTSDARLIRERLRSVVIVRTTDGFGSGFYASNAGIIVTNKHVIGPSHSVMVQRFDRTLAEARVVRVARGFDLALLWDQAAATPHPIPLGDSAEIGPGDAVHAIGHPGGLEFTVTRGIVSATNRHMDGAQYVQTDAVIHPGSSGGPLLDANGQVVGVSTFIRREGLNFALSVRYVHELLGEMMVKPVAPGFRRCVLCGTKNSAARRSCRKCGADFAGQALDDPRAHVEVEQPKPPVVVRVAAPATAEDLPREPEPPVEAPSVVSPTPEREPEPAPEPEAEPVAPVRSEPEPDAFLATLVSALEKLDPPVAEVSQRGRTLHFSWRECHLTATIFRDGEPHVSVTSFAVEMPADDAPRIMRRALELNLSGSLEAKVGMRGSQVYIAAERALEGIDEVEILALLRRVVDVRARFLG